VSAAIFGRLAKSREDAAEEVTRARERLEEAEVAQQLAVMRAVKGSAGARCVFRTRPNH
jgi:hypothetical protein